MPNKQIFHAGVMMVTAQGMRPRTRLDQQRRAVKRGKFQQFCSAVTVYQL